METPRNFPELLKEWEAIRRDLAWVRALRQLKIVTATGGGEVAIQYQDGSENAVLDLRSLTPSGAPPNDGIPAQDGNAYKVLTTDGTSLAWQSPSRFYTSVYRSAAQSISNGAFESVSFDTVESNTFGVWSSSTPTRMTVQASGIYWFSTSIVYANNTTGTRYASIVKNGSGQHQMVDNRAANQGPGGNPVYATVPILNTAVAGDYFELQAYQDSGGALNISGAAGYSIFRMVRVGDTPA